MVAASRIASGKALFSAVTVTEPVLAPPPVWNWAPSRSIRSASCGPVSRRDPSASSEPVSTASPAFAAGSCTEPASTMTRAVTSGIPVCRTVTTRSPLGRVSSSTGGSR